MNNLPRPIVPENCNLGDFPFMPLDVRRLLSSETWILGTGDERAAAMCLWLESWHQIPAGSLPDNDRMLAHLSQCAKWAKVKEQALRGWVKCSDGRLYHKVVAEKALEAWIEKLLNSFSGATGNAKRWDIEIDTRSIKADLIRSVDLLREIAPQSKSLKKSAVLKILSGSTGDQSAIESTPSELSPPDHDVIAPRIAHESPEDRNRQRQGHRNRKGLNETTTYAGEENPVVVSPPDPPDPIAMRAIELTALLRTRGAKLQASDPRVRSWAEQGITDAQALAALERAQQQRSDRGDPSPVNSGYIDAILKSDAPAGARKSRSAMSISEHNAAAAAEAKRLIFGEEAMQ